jgi:hypothetical protein
MAISSEAVAMEPEETQAEETQAVAETPEPDAPTETTPELEVAEDAPTEAAKRTRKARKTVAATRKPKCDNHPALDAVLTTTRGGRVSEQSFCKKCAATLPPNYADAPR